MTDKLRASDLPEGSKVEIRNEGRLFAAYYFEDATSSLYDGQGYAESLEDAIREALEEAS